MSKNESRGNTQNPDAVVDTQSESAVDKAASKWEQLIEAAVGDEPPAATGGEAVDVSELQQELVRLRQLVQDKEAYALRIQAELQNFQRRAEMNVAHAHKYALEKFIVALLPVVDSLERGVETCTEQTLLTVREGMELALKMFVDVLQKFAVEIINPVGEKFNPSCHEAMSMQIKEDVEANTVLHVMQKGYVLNGRVVRPAMVIVARSA